MSYVQQQQHSFKYSTYGGPSGHAPPPDGGAPFAAAAAAQQQQQQQMPPRVLLEPLQLSAGGGLLAGGASPSSRLDDAIAQLRNLGASSAHRSPSVRSSSSARSADDDNFVADVSPGHSLPRHRPAVPPALFAGVPPASPKAWDAAGAAAAVGADGEDATVMRIEATSARMPAAGFSGFTRTTVTTTRQWPGAGMLVYDEETAAGNAAPVPGTVNRLLSGRTAAADATSAALPPKATVTYDTQGRCSCCPYGFHVDVDFMNMPEANSGSGVVAQLKRIREDRRAQRKSVELQLFLQQQLEQQQQQQQLLLEEEQQRRQQAADSRSSTSRSVTIDGGGSAAAFSSSSAVAPPTEMTQARYATIDQNDANQSLFLDDVDSAVRSIGRVVTFADRPKKQSKSSSVSSEDLPQASAIPASTTATSHPMTRSDSMETIDSLTTSDGGAYSLAAHPSSATMATSTVTSRRFAETMAIHLPDTASTEAVTISPESFRQIKEHVSLSLQRMRELEEQVHAIPVMQERISVLKEEKRLLAAQLKAKDVRTNMRSIGVGDSSVDAAPLGQSSSAAAAPTVDAAVGSGDVTEELLPSAELSRLVRETVELTRQREIHAWIETAQLQLHESRLAAMRSVGVGDAVVTADEDMKIREKELRTIVIGQLDDKEQRNVGVQVKAATRDASVLYQYQEEKPLMRTVGVNVDIADLIQNAQEQSAATVLGAAAPAADAATASLSAAEQGGSGLLLTSTSSSSSSSQSWTLQSYAIQRRFLEASRSGRREDLIAFVQGLLRRSVRSFGVVAKPSTCDTSTACDGGGAAGTCDAAVGDDRTDVVVRPAYVARDATTSARPEVSSACTWTESVATRDAASMVAAITVDRSTGAMDMTSFRRDVGMVTVPASVRSMETNTAPLDLSSWQARDETMMTRGSPSLSARRLSPSERADAGSRQSHQLASPVLGSGSRPASVSPSSGEGEQMLYEEWTEVRTIPFEYVSDQVAGGQSVPPLPAELIGLAGKLSGLEVPVALASADAQTDVVDARRVAGSFVRDSSTSTGSFSSTHRLTVSGSEMGGEPSAPRSAKVVAVESLLLAKDAAKAEAGLSGAASTAGGTTRLVMVAAGGLGSSPLEQRRVTTVRLSQPTASREASEVARKDAADAAAAAAALSSMTEGAPAAVASTATTAATRSGSRDAAAERQRMRSAAELLTGSATATGSAVATAVAATTADGAKVERFSSKLERVISAPPLQVDVRVRHAETAAAEEAVLLRGERASSVEAAASKVASGVVVRSTVAGTSMGSLDDACVDPVPAAVDLSAMGVLTVGGTGVSSARGALPSVSGLSGLGSLTVETVEESVSVQGGVTSTSRTVTRSSSSSVSSSSVSSSSVSSSSSSRSMSSSSAVRGAAIAGKLDLSALPPLPVAVSVTSAGAVRALTESTSDRTSSRVARLVANGGSSNHEASSSAANGFPATASPGFEVQLERQPLQASSWSGQRAVAAAASSGPVKAVLTGGTATGSAAVAAVTMVSGGDEVAAASAAGDATGTASIGGASAGSASQLSATSASVTPAKKTISFGKNQVEGCSEPSSSSSSDDDRDSETSFDEGSYDGRKGEVSYVCKEDESLAEGVQAAVSRMSSSKSPQEEPSSSPVPAGDSSGTDGGGGATITRARSVGSDAGGATTAATAATASGVAAAAAVVAASARAVGSPSEAAAAAAEDPACDVDVELQAACSIVQQHIESEGSVPMSQVASALSVIQQDWFKVGGGRSAVARDVEEYLSCFNDFSSELLSRVVNMADANGNTVLHYAVSHCNFDVVRLIVDADVADVNKQNRAGYTPIMLAALADPTSEHDRAVLRRLLGKGDVNLAASRAGQTALMLAVSHGRVDMVRLLIDAGADVNAQDEDGSTSLMCATEHGHTDIVRLLLGRPECDASIKDNDGSTALSIALETAQKEIGLLLYAREHGGKTVLPQAVKKRVAKLPIPVAVATGTGRVSAGTGGSTSAGGSKVLAKKSK